FDHVIASVNLCKSKEGAFLHLGILILVCQLFQRANGLLRSFLAQPERRLLSGLHIVVRLRNRNERVCACLAFHLAERKDCLLTYIPGLIVLSRLEEDFPCFVRVRLSEPERGFFSDLRTFRTLESPLQEGNFSLRFSVEADRH